MSIQIAPSATPSPPAPRNEQTEPRTLDITGNAGHNTKKYRIPICMPTEWADDPPEAVYTIHYFARSGAVVVYRGVLIMVATMLRRAGYNLAPGWPASIRAAVRFSQRGKARSYDVLLNGKPVGWMGRPKDELAWRWEPAVENLRGDAAAEQDFPSFAAAKEWLRDNLKWEENVDP